MIPKLGMIGGIFNSGIGFICSLGRPFLHTVSDQKLESFEELTFGEQKILCYLVETQVNNWTMVE